jgi:hypothetical protein
MVERSNVQQCSETRNKKKNGNKNAE